MTAIPAMRAPAPVLAVEDLKTHIDTRQGIVKAVDGVSFTLAPGEILGLVGESGSGKSMLASSLFRLVEPPVRIVGGRIVFQGRDLLAAGEREMRILRGDRMAMIFQDPMMTLNPVLRIETQMTETVLAHRPVGRAAARELAREALARVGIASAAERLRDYPHQFSGGMRQRVAIAIALLNRPDLIIADEPTTALDVTIQSQILHEMQTLCRESGASLIWITHDLGVVAGLADRVAVMYAGRIVEQGSTAQVIGAPAHPYTRGLIDSLPSRNPPGQRLRQIAGAPPSLAALPSGCAFRTRCPRATEICATDPPPLPEPDGRILRCFHPIREDA